MVYEQFAPAAAVLYFVFFFYYCFKESMISSLSQTILKLSMSKQNAGLIFVSPPLNEINFQFSYLEKNMKRTFYPRVS